MIANNVQRGLFKAPVAVPQTPLDRTTFAARQLISEALTLRDANMARLRAMRLAKMAEDEAMVSSPPEKKKRRASKK